MKRSWIYIILFLLSACAKETDWEAPGQGESFVVVEATITNESKPQEVSLHYSMNDVSSDLLPLSGAEVIINDEDSSWLLLEDEQFAGRYFSQSDLVARTGRNYSLLVIYDGKILSAQASMVAGSAFNPLVYSKNEDNELYHIDYVASAFEAEDPAMWEVLLDWSEVPGYEDLDKSLTTKKLLFYTLTTLDVSQVFAPVVEEVSFPAGTIIQQKRYSLTAEHAEFIRSLLLETSWQGGVFPTDPANATTNISGGGVGYFAVCAVNTLSLTVTP